MKKLLAISLIALLAACSSLPTSFEKPKVSVAGIAVKDIGLFEQRFTLTLRVQNPNNVSVPVSGLNAKLEVNGKPIADGVSNASVTIPALGEATVPVDIVSNLGGLARLLKRGDGAAPSYRLYGKLFSPWKPGGIDFDQKGELPALGDILPAGEGTPPKSGTF
ncbi:LEA type 2 family protein [Jeongeupia naejangsanensis]|uniref:LEA type 2 family protein n=1 Tax=Jeongeupia naejangsanensis TaxID=613195 RepID=A0ABS2BMC7_9NEIS|nr:LEA type 2 family protein [Jeongeupia naejangsanensis]MBM3116151.1 LEA type 2 family protein [Jeongeupia naejangsanensis]